jgi:hypothetical protein
MALYRVITRGRATGFERAQCEGLRPLECITLAAETMLLSS